MCPLLRDDQVDFPHAQQFGPVPHCGCVDVWDKTRQTTVLFSGKNNQHADAITLIWELNHLIFLSLGCGVDAWQTREG